MKNKMLVKVSVLMIALVSSISTVSATTLSYSGQLDLTNLNFPITIGSRAGDASVDVIRFDLGSNLSGTDVQMMLTTNDFSRFTTGVGIVVATDPNDTFLKNPAPLVDVFSPEAIIPSDFLDNNFDGGVVFSWGNVIGADGIDVMAGLFSSPIEFTQGTNYYAFIIGASMVETTVDAQLHVTAVPIPAAWLLMLSGLGLFGMLKKKRVTV